MTDPIPLMVELCAGTAALSLRLHHDGAKPPVSRMGAKTGYANAILRILGLAPGQRAAGYLWCEPDPGVRLLLHAYRDAALAKAAAAIIRGWAAEDPRALWERLRAEGPPRLPEGGADAGEVARFAQIVASNRLINVAWNDAEGRWANTGAGGTTFGGAEFATPPERTADGIDGAPSDLNATIAPDARTVDPLEVARAVITGQWAYRRGSPESGFAEARTGGGSGEGHGDTADMLASRWAAAPVMPEATITSDARTVDPREVARWAWVQGHVGPGSGTPRLGGKFLHPEGDADGSWKAPPRDWLARRAYTLPTIPATIAPDARDIDPPALPPGTVAYLDGPYENTTQYANLLPRAEQIVIARRWAAAGATVAISEAEPIPELVAEGWHAVRIDGERVGQKRNFSKQQAEWLTLNRTPAWVPPVQGSLF